MAFLVARCASSDRLQEGDGSLSLVRGLLVKAHLTLGLEGEHLSCRRARVRTLDELLLDKPNPVILKVSEPS